MMNNVTRREFIQALGALAGVVVANQFDRQLRAMARVLGGSQEWVLSFDEVGLDELIRKSTRLGGLTTDERGRPAIELTLEFEPASLWALATLTAPDGSRWTTMDGENWTCGDRRMVL